MPATPSAAAAAASGRCPPLNAAQQRIHQAALRLFAEKDPATVQISELAAAAQVARGTIYNNLESVDALFGQLVIRLCADMSERIDRAMSGEPDPAMRLAAGVRHYLQRARDEPHWARFILRYGLTQPPLAQLWHGPTMRYLREGIASGRFTLRPGQARTAAVLVAGAVLGGFAQMQQSGASPRRIGSDITELLLLSLGLPASEALRIARARMD